MIHAWHTSSEEVAKCAGLKTFTQKGNIESGWAFGGWSVHLFLPPIQTHPLPRWLGRGVPEKAVNKCCSGAGNPLRAQPAPLIDLAKRTISHFNSRSTFQDLENSAGVWTSLSPMEFTPTPQKMSTNSLDGRSWYKVPFRCEGGLGASWGRSYIGTAQRSSLDNGKGTFCSPLPQLKSRYEYCLLKTTTY